MKKQPMISLSKKTPSEIFFEKINKLGQRFQRVKNKPSADIENESPKVSVNITTQKDNSSDIEKEEVFFEIGSLGFDKYGNLIKW